MAIDGDSTVAGITVGLLAARRLGAALRAGALRAAGFAGAAALGAAALVVRLRAAGRRAGRRAGVAAAGRDVAERAIACTCLVNPSSRFKAFSRSTWLAVRSRRVFSCLSAPSNVFWPSLMLRSICLRTSGGKRRSAWRRYDLPALTARFKSLDLDDVRFFVAMPYLPLQCPAVALTHRVSMSTK